MGWRSTTLRFALLVFLLQVASGVALLLIAGLTVNSNIKAAAKLQADTLRDDLLVVYADGGLSDLVEAARVRTQVTITSGTVILVTDATGRPLAGNLSDWPPSVPPVSGLTGVNLYRSGHVTPEYMWVSAIRLPGGGRLLTGGVMEGASQALRSFADAAGLAFFLALLFAALAAWLAARMIVSRLERTVRTLEGARLGDLSLRVDDDRSGDAFAMLAREVNVTLERIEALVGELKLATDGLAHDLKSPLTRLRSALERAAVDVAEPGTLTALDRALAESDRVLAIVDTALRISRAEAGVGREHLVPTDLATELREIAEIYGPLAEDQGRSIEVCAPLEVTISVHRELLGQALGNLIDNSLKYGDGPITLTLTSIAGGAEITIADRGRGIPAEQHERALTRFGRLDETRSVSGAGLGLSLVSAVVHLHGGSVTLADAAPGLKVAIRLPSPGVAA